MAVYTPLDGSEISELAEIFGLGAVFEYSAVESGIENTNYKLKTAKGRFVVTLYERAGLAEAREVLEITAELGRLGLFVAAPVETGGETAVLYRNKPASAAPLIEGRQVLAPTKGELYSVGETLATLHRKASHLGEGLAEGGFLWRKLEAEVEAGAAKKPVFAAEMIFEARRQAILPEEELPGGFIHADLFLDNLIFSPNSEKVAAILDFFLAGRGPFLFDLAACALDGCFSGEKPDEKLLKALLEGYESVRALEKAERANLLPYMRRAALKYLCLRIKREGEKRIAGAGKNPLDLYQKLLALKS